MGQIKVTRFDIEGLFLVEPTVHGDDRGYFFGSYNENDLKEEGINLKFVQENQSMSKKGVLRGLHFQINHPQGKLVRVLKGRAFDIAVDLRKGSSTFGKWHGEELTEENKKQFYVPEGFAHGFLALSDTVEFLYKVTDFYHPNDEGGIYFLDKTLNIAWPELVDENRLKDGTPLNLSEKDKNWPSFNELFGK